MQTMYSIINGEMRLLHLPSPQELIFPQIQWGAFDEILTPAYWKGQVWQHSYMGTYSDLRLGSSLAEEVAACLLGGYGMPADLALAAYRRVRDLGILDSTPPATEIEAALDEPLLIGGRLRRYRFIRQKAKYLSACLERLCVFEEPKDDRKFREKLAGLPGVGLKTASWIVRNRRPDSDVAIIDVHILRAGLAIGLFPEDWTPQKHYLKLEGRFVAFSRALNAAPAMLDALMWDYMRRFSDAVLRGSPTIQRAPLDLCDPTEELAMA